MPARRDPFLLALAILCLLRLGLLAPGLVPADLNLTYPFMDGDSWDWIGNGLRLAGEDVRYSGRSPLLPLAIALLHRLSALSWLPVVLQGLFLATVLAFYSLAARLTSRRATFAAALALLFNYSLMGLSLQVMADVPTACLLLLAVRSFVLAGEDHARRRYLASGLFAGLAALGQMAGVLWAPAAGVTALVHRRRDFRSPWLWVSLLAPVILPAFWTLVQPPTVAGPGGLARAQILLLSLHADSVPFYLYSLVSLLGIPGAVLMIAGAALAVRRAGQDPARFLSLALAGALAIFFVFLYDYNGKRFLVYGVWLWGLFLAEALARIRRRAAFGTAAIVLLAGSALPLPVAPEDASAAGLWPAPPVYLIAPVSVTATGSSALDPGAARLARRPMADWVRLSLPYRAWEARRRQKGFASLDPALFRADHSALYVHGDAIEGAGRYITIARLGNALGKRVKFVPATWLEPYWRRMGVEPLGLLGPDYALYRIRLAGLGETWLLAVAPGGPLKGMLDELGARPSRGRPAAGGPRLVRGRQTAEAIARFVAGSDGFVAAVPSRRPDDLWQLYLPFLLDSTELYAASPGQARELLGILAGTPTLAEAKLGTATVKKTEYLGRRTSLITGTAEPPPPPPPRRPRRRQIRPAPGAGAPPGG
ncbi:MAG TPA: glycosyltransferase family 39 protein [Thermoanaerobaculia bacterium]|nr:glycosyltransferase family 39 protein [Thermoanaerobaculia bacterium]